MSAGVIYYRTDDNGEFDADNGLVIRGTAGDDTFTVNNLYRSNHTEVYASAGDDTVVVNDFDITGRTPTLTIYGESGSDYVDASLSPVFVTLYGNLPQQDVASGLIDEDTLIGSQFDDIIEGNGGVDIIIGNNGNDTIDGGDGNDIIFGDSGAVTMTVPLAAGPVGDPVYITSTDFSVGGEDVIVGGQGIDLIMGGQGTDTISGDAGGDILLGDVGIAQYTDGVLRSIETKPFFVGALDEISGGAGEDVLFGGQGSDVLNADFLSDTIIGYYGRILFDEQSFVTSVVILGVDGQDLVASEQGTLYENQEASNAAQSDYYNNLTADQLRRIALGDFSSSTVASASSASRYSSSAVNISTSLTKVPSLSVAVTGIHGSYQVVRGDTLSEIMESYGLKYPQDLQRVLDLNKFITDPSYIQSGWDIKVVEDEIPAEETVEPEQQPEPQQETPAENTEQDAAAQTEQPPAAIAAAAAGLVGWKVHSNPGAGNSGTNGADRSELKSLDEKARKRRLSRWDGKRVVGYK
jgi:Ca2+-binding RTX toxin-like protein